MTYSVLPLEPGKKWKISAGDLEVGTVERLATGYLVTQVNHPTKVKRYRMIDALRESLGEDTEIVIIEG